MSNPTTTKHETEGAPARKNAPVAPAKQAGRNGKDVPVGLIDPDPNNRRIDEADEAFVALADSVAVFGVLQRLHVRQDGDRYQLIDGERRWRAATRAGLGTVPCEIWPADSTRADVLAAGIVLNEQRQAHTLVHMARRLRELKNAEGLSAEQLVHRVSLPLERVKNYLSLLRASDELLEFFSTVEVPLRVAVEMLRYEQATSEAKSRALIKRYREEPLTREQLVKMRKRETDSNPDAADRETNGVASRRSSLATLIERAYRSNPETAAIELERILEPLGFGLVRLGKVG